MINRPTFLGFDTAKRGIMTAQKGLDITGQNLVNWDSAGYTRQRVEQVAVAQNPYGMRYGNNRIGIAGQGVDIQGIGQVRDKFLDKRFREEVSDVGYFDQVNKILGDLESTASEFLPTSDSGVRFMLKEMISSLTNFADQADSSNYANLVMSSFKNMTQTLQQLSSKLDNVANQQKFDLGVSVESFNQILSKLDGLNKAISADLEMRDNPHYGPNELLDARNLLLDDLAAFGGIEIITNKNNTVTVKMGEHTILDGNTGKYDKIDYHQHQNGTVSLSWVSTGEKIHLPTGILKGYTDFINGRGPNIQQEAETTYRGIPYYKDQLDILAGALVEVANNTIPVVDEEGKVVVGDDGKTVYKKLLGSMVEGEDGKFVVRDDGNTSASNIAISDDWTKDPGYLILKEGSLENKYINELATKLKNGKFTFQGRSESFSGTFNEFCDRYSATLAEDKNYYNNRLLSSATIQNEIMDQRDSVSGVVVDEEVSNVMLYQKSLQAASRLMTTLDEALDVLINRTGVVGR